MKRLLALLLSVALGLSFGLSGFSEDQSCYFNDEENHVYASGPAESRKIALTFDDGPHPCYTDEILDILYEFTREEDQSVLISSHIVSDLERLCDYIAYIDQGSLKLYEEKDCLIEQYGILKCSKEELKEFDEQAVKGVRENPYGVEALVDRSKMPRDYETDMATLEEIIVFLSKGQEE